MHSIIFDILYFIMNLYLIGSSFFIYKFGENNFTSTKKYFFRILSSYIFIASIFMSKVDILDTYLRSSVNRLSENLISNSNLESFLFISIYFIFIPILIVLLSIQIDLLPIYKNNFSKSILSNVLKMRQNFFCSYY